MGMRETADVYISKRRQCCLPLKTAPPPDASGGGAMHYTVEVRVGELQANTFRLRLKPSATSSGFSYSRSTGPVKALMAFSSPG